MKYSDYLYQLDEYNVGIDQITVYLTVVYQTITNIKTANEITEEKRGFPITASEIIEKELVLHYNRLHEELEKIVAKRKEILQVMSNRIANNQFDLREIISDEFFKMNFTKDINNVTDFFKLYELTMNTEVKELDAAVKKVSKFNSFAEMSSAANQFLLKKKYGEK